MPRPDDVAIADRLGRDGHVVVPGFVDGDLLAALRERAVALAGAGGFRPAATGAAGGRAVRPELRGDEIHWLADDGDAAEHAWLARMERLRAALNERLYLGLFELECHFARYAPGARYDRHLDRFAGDAPQRGERVVSVVAYLNDGWDRDDGGELRLHLDEGASVDVLPAGGTLALFLSERIWHEVRPARRERLSLTGWFRRRPRV